MCTQERHHVYLVLRGPWHGKESLLVTCELTYRAMGNE